MNAVLIQPREEFGPPERVTELHQCWAYNDAVFSHVIAQAGTPTHTRTPMKTLLAIIIALIGLTAKAQPVKVKRQRIPR